MYQARLEESDGKRRTAIDELTSGFTARIDAAQEERVTSLRTMEDKHLARVREMEEHHTSVCSDLEASFSSKLEEADERLKVPAACTLALCTLVSLFMR